MGCPTCGASGKAKCGECGGSGRTYARSSRGAKCKTCRETGRVHCAACDGSTKVACNGCSGSGKELVWWEYEEAVRVVVTIPTESPIFVAHRHLGEERFLNPRDLQGFTPFVTVQHTGPIPRGQLEADDEALLATAGPRVDAHLERVRTQQFLSFGAVRRDVRYEMCGVEGTVSLTGDQLVGARTQKALAPHNATTRLSWGRRCGPRGVRKLLARDLLGIGRLLRPGAEQDGLAPHDRRRRCASRR